MWVNDHVKVGLTANANEEGDAESSLEGADVTLRMSADSWLKVQGGRSEGLVSSVDVLGRRRLRLRQSGHDRLHCRRAPMRIAPT